MLTQTDFAYIAGYTDGDGCFYMGKQFCKKQNYFKFPMAFTIASTNPIIIEWLKEQFGGCQRRDNKKRCQQKTMYYFILRKERAIELIKNISPYFVEKAEQAKTFCEFAETNSTESKDYLMHELNEIKFAWDLVSKEHKKEFELLRKTIIPTEIDFAYLAGFIDAECCLCIQRWFRTKYPNQKAIYKILLQCNNTKAPIFKWLLQRFGGQIHFINRKIKNPNERDQLTYRLSGKSLVPVLEGIYPFLKYKKPVCEQLMKFYATTLINGGARHTKTFRSQYAETLKIREEIVSTVHKLNLKGIKSS